MSKSTYKKAASAQKCWEYDVAVFEKHFVHHRRSHVKWAKRQLNKYTRQRAKSEEKDGEQE